MPGATLFRYLAGRTIFVAAALLIAFSGLIVFIDVIENLRFVEKFDKGNFGFALVATLLRAPSLVQTLLPFVFLFAGIWIFTQLNRRAEIAVMRAAGLSVWGLLAPAALVAAGAGAAAVVAVDPAATALLGRSEAMKNELRGAPPSIVRIFGDGVWLRQRDADETLVINARGFDPARAALLDVVVWRLDRTAAFIERIDGPEAVLAGRTIEIRKARVAAAGEPLDYRTPVYAIPTSFSAEDMRERVNEPATLSIWRLPRFILLSRAAGLPTDAYDVRFHDLCSTPLKLTAMILIAAMFSLRPIRSGGALKLFGLAAGAGFAFYILSEISSALGESQLAPPALSAWTPAAAATLFAVAGLLYLEEG
jgi:lipopolysaccharide export system permease protein